MNIGIICYASVGGSGIVATELGKALASRGHRVHVISTETPFRFGDYQAGLTFHQVVAPSYPLFREPQYLLSIANKVVEVGREFSLDIVHAHYAVPHATAAFHALCASLAGAVAAATSAGGADGFFNMTATPRMATSRSKPPAIMDSFFLSFTNAGMLSVTVCDPVAAAEDLRALGEVDVARSFIPSLAFCNAPSWWPTT